MNPCGNGVLPPVGPDATEVSPVECTERVLNFADRPMLKFMAIAAAGLAPPLSSYPLSPLGVGISVSDCVAVALAVIGVAPVWSRRSNRLWQNSLSAI